MVILTSCAVSIIKDGSKVRQINLDGVNDCKFLGIVETGGGLFYSSIPEANRDMYNKLRKETACRGGNAFAVTYVEVEHGLAYHLLKQMLMIVNNNKLAEAGYESYI